MVDRRQFLELSSLAVLGGLVGRAHEPSRELLVHSLRPENLATPIEWFDRAITPTDVFFVRSHFGAPSARGKLGLRVDGLVSRSLDLSLDDLAALPQADVTAVLQCAGNGRALHEPRVPGIQWVHGAMGQATWSGVRLRDLLDRAGIASAAAHVALDARDVAPTPTTPAFERSIPRERALDPTTLVALRMNGEPLTLAHGAPLRLVLPGWAGNHWVKWLRAIRPQAEPTGGFFMQTAYRLPREPVEPGAAVPPESTVPVTTFPIKSIIARPTDGSMVPRGTQEVVGVAFSGEASIARVELSLDGGASWRPAALEGPGGVGRWQVFRLRFEAQPGTMRAVVRAIDAQGAVQPERAQWNPSGYFWNGWHSVKWNVA